jgi:colanic acid/amylovoran biosynthesis glycosyltransferase
VAILCYHTVDPTWRSGLSMPPEAFAAHCRWLAHRRHVVDLATATRLTDRRGRQPGGLAAITFDDGLSGVHEHALPVLRSLRLPATVFVVADTLRTADRDVDWVDDPPEHRLTTVTLEQLREMVEAGVEVGSHSLHHHVLTELEPPELIDDLRTSRELLEDLLGRPVRHLAYPRGRHDERVRAAAHCAGYAHAYGLPQQREPVGPYAIPRVGVFGHNGVPTLRVKATDAYLPVRTSSAFPTIRRLVPRRPRPRPPVRPPRIAYVMSRFPKVTETFVLNEILTVERLGEPVRIQPLLQERGGTVQPGAADLVARAHFLPWLSPAIVGSQLWYLRHQPRRYLRTLGRVLLGTAGSLNFTVGALGILPKVVHAARQMEAAGIEHVHCHFASHPALAGYVVHELTGIPYSFTAHGSDLHVDRHMLPQKVATAAHVVTVSAYNRDLIVRECGSEVADRLHVVHTGVDTELFRPRSASRVDTPRDRALRVVCVGTLHEVKGQHVLIEAVALLTRQGVPVHLLLVGDGPWRERLRRAAETAGVTDRVRFAGATDRDGVRAALADADVVAAPSVPTRAGKREGIPVALMEAMACGLPVVASHLSGIPELVEDGTAGLLVPPGDASALAAALHRLARDPALRARLGAAGRRRVVAEFDLERNVRHLLELLLPGRAVPVPAAVG